MLKIVNDPDVGVPSVVEGSLDLDEMCRLAAQEYDFPAEHWKHLRSTNAIESTFATVRLRTKVTKGAGSRQAALAMVYKLCDAAQTRWRRIDGTTSSPSSEPAPSELVREMMRVLGFQKRGSRIVQALGRAADQALR